MANEISVSRVVADVAIIVLCAIPLIVFHWGVEPYHRGFFCTDNSIRYPYKPGTVTRLMLVLMGSVITLAVLFTCEVIRLIWWESPAKTRRCNWNPPVYQLAGRNIHRFIVRIYIFLGYFLLGVMLNQMLTDVAKYSIGRLRPHFIDICVPNVLRGSPLRTCTNMAHKFITNYTCTGSRVKQIHDARLSFYSGHASFSFYMACYLVLYMRARMYKPVFSQLLVPVAQFLLFGLACAVSYSRVSNYKHHWSDVLFGSLMGTLVALFVAIYIAELPERRELPGDMFLDTDGQVALVSSSDEHKRREDRETIDNSGKKNRNECNLEEVGNVVPFTSERPPPKQIPLATTSEVVQETDRLCELRYEDGD